MDKKVLYIEGTSGISGDMFVGAMIDLGADLEVLTRTLDSIPAEGFAVEVDRIKKCGIDCVDFDVILDAAHENHDHDMAYLYGKEPAVSAEAEPEDACRWHQQGTEDALHSHEDMEDILRHSGDIHCHCHGGEEGEAHPCCGHHHGDGECHGHHHSHHHDHNHDQGGDGHEHCHGHCHDHGHDGHYHEHRCLADVDAVIAGTDMTDRARALARQIFLMVAEAESKAHRLPIEEVHFHEVGAIDSIVDIISAAVCFDNLGITDVIIPSLSEGRGTVRCQHGILPVPVPATLNIAEKYGLPLEIMDAAGEFVTPTGAAIAAAIRTSDTLPAHFKILRTGLGAGKREYTERPGFLRAMIIDPGEEGKEDDVVMLQTDIDDSTGEALGYVLERLMEAGARDAHYTPVYMKKNRPAWELTVICDGDDQEKMKEIIFQETTTIGIREIPVHRTILPREEITVATPFGEAQVKCCAAGNAVRYYPEYETVRAIARAQGIPFMDAYRMIMEAADQK